MIGPDEMKFSQIGPNIATRPDGAVLELLVDRYHANLRSDSGDWIVEVAPADDDDWFAIKVYPDTLLRSGGEPSAAHRAEALFSIVEGLRSLRIRTHVEEVVLDLDVEVTAVDD